MVITAIPMFEAQQDEVVIYWTEESLHLTVNAKYERRLMLNLGQYIARLGFLKSVKLDEAVNKVSENTSYVISLNPSTTIPLDQIRRAVRNEAEVWLKWANENIPQQARMF